MSDPEIGKSSLVFEEGIVELSLRLSPRRLAVSVPIIGEPALKGKGPEVPRVGGEPLQIVEPDGWLLHHITGSRE